MTASLEAIQAQLRAVVTNAKSGLDAANELCLACVELFELDGAAVSMVQDGTPQWTIGASSARSRRLDEYQFTFGQGPCIDAVAGRQPVLVPDLNAPDEQRWPVFAEALLHDGIRSVFALPITVATVCVGALDLFREAPGPLRERELAGAALAARMATRPLIDLIAPDGLNGNGPVDDGVASRGGSELGGGGDAMEWDRVEVYQATGMLIHQLDVDASEALVRLRARAMATGQTATQVATAIIERRLVLDRDDRNGDGEGRQQWDQQ